MTRAKRKKALERFKKWLDEQPVGKEWNSTFVYEMLKGNNQTELPSSAMVHQLMAKFDNVEKLKTKNKCVIYRKKDPNELVQEHSSEEDL